MRPSVLRRLSTLVLGAALVSILYTAVLRSSYYLPHHQTRSEIGSDWQTRGVTVGVVWPRHEDMSLAHGITLAAEEINASRSPLAGKIKVKYFEEAMDSTGESGAKIAREVARNGSITAVLGHEVSASAVPASLTYESHGILFLTPKSTDPRLTTHNFQYTFRLTPNDRHIAATMVEFAKKKGWGRVGILYARTPGGESMGPRLLTAATEQGLDVVFMRSYLGHDRGWDRQDFRPLIADVQKEQFDAILVYDQLPRAAKLVIDLHRMGVEAPVIGCDKMDSELLWQLAREKANQVYVVSAVDPDATTHEYLAFRERFRRRFGADPDYGASQGHEALTTLVEAIEQSGTADPLIVSTTLRHRKWKGLFGDFTFDNNGDVQGRQLSVKKLENGKFSTVHF